MSWFSKNYEKAALGGAVAVALGLAYLGWSKFGGVDEDFDASLKGDGQQQHRRRRCGPDSQGDAVDEARPHLETGA